MKYYQCEIFSYNINTCFKPICKITVIEFSDFDHISLSLQDNNDQHMRL